MVRVRGRRKLPQRDSDYHKSVSQTSNMTFMYLKVKKDMVLHTYLLINLEFICIDELSGVGGRPVTLNGLRLNSA